MIQPMIRFSISSSLRRLGFSAALLVELIAGNPRVSAQAITIPSPQSDPLAEPRALMASKQFSQSESFLHQYLSAHPTSAEAHFLLGTVLFHQQKATDSLAEFTQGAKTKRPSAEDLKTVAADYILLGDFTDADKWFSAVTAESPSDVNAWYLLGRTQYNESQFDKAISSFEHALQLRPKDVEAENNLGLAYRDLEQADKAKAAFQNAIDWQGETPIDAQPFLNLGTMLTAEGALDKALPYLVKAGELSPKNPKMHEQLGDAYQAREDLSKAQAEFEQAVSLSPDSSGLHFKLGQVYRKQGLKDQAKHEFDICAKLNSSHASKSTPNPYLPGAAAPQ